MKGRLGGGGKGEAGVGEAGREASEGGGAAGLAGSGRGTETSEPVEVEEEEEEFTMVELSPDEGSVTRRRAKSKASPRTADTEVGGNAEPSKLAAGARGLAF